MKNEDYLVLSHPVPDWPLPDLLTRSEREVVRAVLAGASRAEVARVRGTSRNTVANILASAFRKLGVNSRLELAARLASRSEPPS
jgi:DNA-binding CsgD family transcriptional regulator